MIIIRIIIFKEEDKIIKDLIEVIDMEIVIIIKDIN